MTKKSSFVTVSVKEMKALDRGAVEKFGMPSILLMENAGRGIAALASGMVRKGKILIVCGKGNNGGDGFVAARHLASRGRDVEIALLALPESPDGDAGVNYFIVKAMKIPVLELWKESALKMFQEKLAASALVIDSVLGVGVSKPVQEPLKRLLQLIESSGKPVLAVDLPSGLDGDTGRMLGYALPAAMTATLGAVKQGLIKPPGRKLAGKVVLVDIGLPRLTPRAGF